MSERKYYFVSYTQNVNGRNYFYNIGVIDNPLNWLGYKNNSSPNNPCTILFFKEIPYRDYLLLARDTELKFINLSDEEKEKKMNEIKNIKENYLGIKENPELEEKIKAFKLWRKMREDESSKEE